MLRFLIYLCIVIQSLTFAHIGQAAEFNHEPWDNLLKEFVHYDEGGLASSVDYQGMQGKHGILMSYLRSLSQVRRDDFDSWTSDEQLAFLLNAYNGWTVDLILTKYPNLESIKDLGTLFSSPWKKKFIPLFGEKISLDDIEHGYIRGSGRYQDPRIHFAVNCASVGCPALRAEAYRGAFLEKQLEDGVRKFLSDRTRNRFGGKNLEVSSIFKWYREDFGKGWREIGSLAEFLAYYHEPLGLKKEEAELLAQGKIPIRYLEYDWSLNSFL